ncbi:MAG: HRDC domain-containing protein [Planctomycetia bacterium]|nr:HRDC domain-containing protein [Planctomycetia bacterium]
MEIALFEVNSLDPTPGLALLNEFLKSHTIQQVIEYPSHYNGYLVIFYSVTHLGERTVNPSSSVASNAVSSNGNDSKNVKVTVDYMLVLTEQEFSVFRTLRERRAAFSRERGLVEFNICLNYPIACAVALRVRSKSKLIEINGIGPATADGFGVIILEEIEKALQNGTLDPTPRTLPPEAELKRLYSKPKDARFFRRKRGSSESPREVATKDAESSNEGGAGDSKPAE